MIFNLKVIIKTDSSIPRTRAWDLVTQLENQVHKFAAKHEEFKDVITIPEVRAED